MATLPEGFRVFSGGVCVWKEDGTGPYMVDPVSGEPMFALGMPTDLYTDGGTGPSRRLRVDVGQTGFFAGREFRSYFELNVPVAGQRSFRFTSPVDFILTGQSMELDQGGLRLAIFAGTITPGGTWTSVPVIGRNRMLERPQPYYVPLVSIETGGTFTGGDEQDVLRVKTTTQSNQASNVGGEQDDVRGLPPGTYYVRLEPLAGVNDASLGVYSVRWEERTPP